jgi:hypothetical protein
VHSAVVDARDVAARAPIRQPLRPLRRGTRGRGGDRGLKIYFRAMDKLHVLKRAVRALSDQVAEVNAAGASESARRG